MESDEGVHNPKSPSPWTQAQATKQLALHARRTYSVFSNIHVASLQLLQFS
jgi:hypothetical protein